MTTDNEPKPFVIISHGDHYRREVDPNDAAKAASAHLVYGCRNCGEYHVEMPAPVMRQGGRKAVFDRLDHFFAGLRN